MRNLRNMPQPRALHRHLPFLQLRTWPFSFPVLPFCRYRFNHFYCFLFLPFAAVLPVLPSPFSFLPFCHFAPILPISHLPFCQFRHFLFCVLPFSPLAAALRFTIFTICAALPSYHCSAACAVFALLPFSCRFTDLAFSPFAHFAIYHFTIFSPLTDSPFCRFSARPFYHFAVCFRFPLLPFYHFLAVLPISHFTILPIPLARFTVFAVFCRFPVYHFAILAPRRFLPFTVSPFYHFAILCRLPLGRFTILPFPGLFRVALPFYHFPILPPVRLAVCLSLRFCPFWHFAGAAISPPPYPILPFRNFIVFTCPLTFLPFLQLRPSRILIVWGGRLEA